MENESYQNYENAENNENSEQAFSLRPGYLLFGAIGILAIFLYETTLGVISLSICFGLLILDELLSGEIRGKRGVAISYREHPKVYIIFMVFQIVVISVGLYFGFTI